MSPATLAEADDARLGVTLTALADPHRRRVVQILSEGPRRAGELAQALSLSPPAMSRHLRTLRQSGLVEERHDGFDARVRVYQLRPEPMAALAAWLQQTEALWATQLGAFREHLRSRDAGGPA
jgi:DNA-binding transcriptional ArsR family regulator